MTLDMKIQFLKECIAPQMHWRFCCEICGHIPCGMEPTTFFKDEVVDDPDIGDTKVDLSGLTFRIDYDIVSFP